MKRTVSILLSLAIFLSLCACGRPELSGSVGSAAPEPSLMDVELAEENTQGYVIPAAWTENSVNDGTYGYVTAAAEPDLSGDPGFKDGYLVTLSRDTETQMTTLTRYTLDGSEVSATKIPPMEGSDTENTDSYIGLYSFGEDCIWMTHERYTVLDEETGETENYAQLEQWNYEGECRAAIPLEDILLPEDRESFVYDMTISPEGDPILTSENYIYFCDSTGAPAATVKTAGNHYSFCLDSGGRLYLSSLFENQIYTIDWDAHAPGDVVFSTTGNEAVLPGGGAYDFFLKSDTLLRGVCLETGTITELLSWTDWDLAGSVGDVLYLDQDTYLIMVYSLLDVDSGSQLLTLSRVPANEIPEKTIVRLAVPLNEIWAKDGATWADSLDQRVAEAMNQFNRESSTYRVEVETFGSAQDLQLMLSAGDIPDLLYWGQGTLEDSPSIPLLAKNGYLLDLEPLFDRDPELSTEDFLPNLLELAKSQANGLYAMPIEFYFVTLTGKKEYVGDSTGWTISDMIAAAWQLPEDMEVWEYISQWDALDTLLRCTLSDFMDVNAGTCQFETQEFYELLNFCRDYFPQEVGEDYTPSENAMLTGEGGMGRMGQFASDVIRPLEEQGKTLIGYPGAGDSGLSIIFYQEMSIFAQGLQQEGAWEFLRTLYSYDYQYSCRHSVRSDAFNAREDWYLELNDSCTEAESQAIRQRVQEATQLRLAEYPCSEIIQEEAAAFFSGDKTAEETARIIQNRVEIYLAEQS